MTSKSTGAVTQIPEPEDGNLMKEFDIYDDAINIDGPWFSRLPSWCTMPLCTIIFAGIGLAFGIGLNNADIADKWMDCYSSTSPSVTNAIVSCEINELTCPLGYAYKKVQSVGKPKSCWLELFEYPGMLWIRALKCLVSPLLACMMLLVPTQMKSLGPVGVRVAGLLLTTSFFAAMEGLVWVNIIRPGSFISDNDGTFISGNGSPGKKSSSGNYVSELEAFLNIGVNAVPKNIFDELANLRVLGIITFFLVLGYQLTNCPKEWRDPILNSGRGFLRAIVSFLGLVMWWTPIAMFSLVSYNLMAIDDIGGVMEAVGMYVLTQLLGQIVHLCGFYFTFYFLLTGKNPFRFYYNIMDAPLTALATSSSAATLPVTMAVNLKEKAEDDDFGRQVVKFVVPLGAAINMDGTSLGFPVMVVFAHQMGEELTKLVDGQDVPYIDGGMMFGDMLFVAFLAMVCSLGTAPIPNAGLVYLTMLLEAGNIPEGIHGLALSAITIFDWLVDRVETAQNVGSDSFISSIIAVRMKDKMDMQMALNDGSGAAADEKL